MSHNGDSAQAVVTEKMVHQSLGRLFRDAGYETVYGGKVHLPSKMKGVENLGYRNLTNDRRQGLGNACAEFLKGRHEKPFLLFASFINPHDICYMAINDFNRTQQKDPIDNEDSKICESVLDRARQTGDIGTFVEKHCPPLPANHAVPEGEAECIMEKYINPRPFQAYTREKWPEDQWRLHRWAYCRLTEMVDREIGTVLDALKEAGLEDNTLIVFTSDHGDMDSSHKLEHKQVLYEESIHVPFIMSYKGRIPASVVDDSHFVSNGLDLLPTLCDYVGIKIPEGLPGRSLRPLAEGKAMEWRRFVVVESHYSRMVRTKRFKYCIYDSGRHREQLIDMANDPGEMKNLVGDENYKDVLEKHQRLLHEWIENTDDKIGANYVIAG
jgi:arylsulfatase A-like enzyme